MSKQLWIIQDDGERDRYFHRTILRYVLTSIYQIKQLTQQR